jgi:hypothetical protein
LLGSKPLPQNRFCSRKVFSQGFGETCEGLHHLDYSPSPNPSRQGRGDPIWPTSTVPLFPAPIARGEGFKSPSLDGRG